MKRLASAIRRRVRPQAGAAAPQARNTAMPLNTQEHTSKHFDAELETVRSRVLQMGGLVETADHGRHRGAHHRQPPARRADHRQRPPGERAGGADRRGLHAHHRPPPAGRAGPAHDHDGHQDDHRPRAHRRRGGEDRAHDQAHLLGRAAPAAALRRDQGRRGHRPRDAQEGAGRLRARGHQRGRRRRAARTACSTSSSAASCASSSPS